MRDMTLLAAALAETRAAVTAEGEMLVADWSGVRAEFARDANGIALGGIRQAEVEAPIATNRGDQPGITPGCSNLYGQHVAFDEGKLAQLYPTHADYVRAVTQAVRDNVRDGFVLKEDAEEIIRRARNSSVGTGRPLPIQ